MDQAVLAKQQGALQGLARLKYGPDDASFCFLTGFFAALKAGFATGFATEKYEGLGDQPNARIAKDQENKLLFRVGSCLSTYLESCKSLTEVHDRAQLEGCLSPLFGLKPGSVFGEAPAEWNVFF